MLEKAKNNLSEEEYYSEFGWYAEKIYNALNDVYQDYNRNLSKLSLAIEFSKDYGRFNGDIREIVDKAITEAYAETKGMDLNSGKYQDSISTRIIKKLGFEGIDVSGYKGLDNTTYGSVIYDLKGKDLELKRSIGTAMYSTRDNKGNRIYTQSDIDKLTTKFMGMLIAERAKNDANLAAVGAEAKAKIDKMKFKPADARCGD